MYRTTVSSARVFGHSLAVVLTGGLWLIPLTVRFLLSHS